MLARSQEELESGTEERGGREKDQGGEERRERWKQFLPEPDNFALLGRRLEVRERCEGPLKMQHPISKLRFTVPVFAHSYFCFCF